MNGKYIFLAILLGWIIPLLLLKPFSSDKETKRPEPTLTQEQTTVQVQTEKVRVLQSDETVTEMDTEEYLAGVILGELPSSFHDQAVMAQAVVARTFTYRAMQSGFKHTNADVCTDSGCCQAYTAPEDYIAKDGSAEFVLRVQNALEQTCNMVLCYEEKLIDATYFSCSGGKTEDAVAVWGADVPYLQSRESPGEELATHYMDTVNFSKEEFCQKLSLESSYVKIGEITYTRGGGVDTILINGQAFTGMQMRSLLSLRSTAFVISALPEHITITTKGYGHRVGMSQYGAQAMAVSGSTYEQILAHYYTDTELTYMEPQRSI